MNMVTFSMLMLAAFWSGAAVALIGVVIGGMLVFRTKREGYERLFGSPPSGGSYSSDPLDDGSGAYNSDPYREATPPPAQPLAPDPFRSANEKISELLARQMARDANSMGMEPQAKYEDGPEPLPENEDV